MPTQQPTLVFDGDCGFCTTSARWIERRLDPEVLVERWQALDLDALGLSVEDVTTAAYFVDEQGSLHRGHAAVGRSFEHMALPFRLVGRAIQHRPVAWVAAPTYRLVAKYRYKLPGATEACRVD